jgi:hypothetical protein
MLRYNATRPESADFLYSTGHSRKAKHDRFESHAGTSALAVLQAVAGIVRAQTHTANMG